MPLDGFNTPEGRQGQEAERLYQTELGHENLGRLLDELLFRQDALSDRDIAFSSQGIALACSPATFFTALNRVPLVTEHACHQTPQAKRIASKRPGSPAQARDDRPGTPRVTSPRTGGRTWPRPATRACRSRCRGPLGCAEVETRLRAHGPIWMDATAITGTSQAGPRNDKAARRPLSQHSRARDARAH